MSLLTIAAFDIETVPDTEIGRRIDGFEGAFRDVAEAMQNKRLEETDQASDFLQPPFHRIVTISVAWIDLDKAQFKLATLGKDSNDEGDMLEAFFHVLAKSKPRLVSWNGNGFDLPVIRYRAMLHGINGGAYYNDNMDRYNNYVNRYHDLHVDLMDVLAGYGASRPMGLDRLCQIMGLPGKTVTEGHRVFQHIGRGEWELVQTYCELDALNTLLLYLAWEQSRGRLAGNQFTRAVTQMADQLGQDLRPAVSDYAKALVDWQPGRSRDHLRQELS